MCLFANRIRKHLGRCVVKTNYGMMLMNIRQHDFL